MKLSQSNKQGKPKLSRRQATKGVFKNRNPRPFTSVKGLKLCKAKATMEAEKGMGDETEDAIYMVADHDELFPNDPVASEGAGGEVNSRPTVDPMLPQMETPDNGGLNPQMKVALKFFDRHIGRGGENLHRNSNLPAKGQGECG